MIAGWPLLCCHHRAAQSRAILSLLRCASHVSNLYTNVLQVEDLKQYLERCAVVPSATDACTSAEVVQEITRRMGEAMGSCMQALNLGGLKLQALMDAVATR